MTPERWASIPEFPGYSVSTLGRIMGLRGKVLRWSDVGAGYCTYKLQRDGRAINIRGHLAVLRAFTGPPPESHEGSHLNGDRQDNAWENLVWMTHQENVDLCAEHGNVPRGEAKSASKLTEVQVVEIRAASLAGLSPRRLARQYGVNRTTVRQIIRREKWSHVA